jgi:hypothetical protein
MFCRYRGTVVKATINPIIAGLLPKCVTLLKIATLVILSFDIVASKLADLYPVHELIKFKRVTFF